MIDTINLYIYDLEKYASIVNQLESYASSDGVSTVPKVSTEAVEKIKATDFAAYTFYHDTDTFRFRNYRSVFTLPSSHYSMAFYINREVLKKFRRKGIDYDVQGRIEFSFSIPKSIWRNNVMQFVRYSDTSCSGTFEALKSFIDGFRRQFMAVIDLQDIEINRLDLCYNQYFFDKAEALAYLQQQKILLPKFSKAGTTREFGLDIVTRRYKFKIYHKGAEFYKNDFKELQKSNVTTGFRVDELAREADRILRYEVTFRKTMFTYLMHQMYADGANADKKKGTLYNFLWTKKFEERPQLLFMCRSEYDKLDKVKAFAMAEAGVTSTLQVAWWNYYRDLNYVTFNADLFGECYNFFWMWFKKFQLTTIGSNDTIQKKIAELNRIHAMQSLTAGKKKRKPKYNENRLLEHIQYSQLFSLKSKIGNGTMSRSQYYAVMKLFKRIGLSDHNPNLAVRKPSTDYQEYKRLHRSWHTNLLG